MESNWSRANKRRVFSDRMVSRVHRNLPRTQESTTPYTRGRNLPKRGYGAPSSAYGRSDPSDEKAFSGSNLNDHVQAALDE
jgi:hypothetical protein